MPGSGGQIGHDNLGVGAVFGFDARRQLPQARLIAGHEHEVIVIGGEAEGDNDALSPELAPVTRARGLVTSRPGPPALSATVPRCRSAP